MMKYIKLENLETEGELTVQLATIFDRARLIYNQTTPNLREQVESMPKEVLEHPAMVRLRKEMAQVEGFFTDFPNDVPSLIALFQYGRTLDQDCTPSPSTKRYLDARKAVNQVLDERGIEVHVL